MACPSHLGCLTQLVFVAKPTAKQIGLDQVSPPSCFLALLLCSHRWVILNLTSLLLFAPSVVIPSRINTPRLALETSTVLSPALTGHVQIRHGRRSVSLPPSDLAEAFSIAVECLPAASELGQIFMSSAGFDKIRRFLCHHWAAPLSSSAHSIPVIFSSLPSLRPLILGRKSKRCLFSHPSKFSMPNADGNGPA